jgi:hypothetical protein
MSYICSVKNKKEMNTKMIKMPVKDNLIDWSAPASDVEVTIEDYRNMILQAEREKGMTFTEYTKKVNQWLKSNL